MLNNDELEYLQERNTRRISQIKFDIKRNRVFMQGNLHYKTLVENLEAELAQAETISKKLKNMTGAKTGLDFRTLFRAYGKAMGQMETHSRLRFGGSFGIAIDTDHHALRWQRYNRLARRIEYRLMGVDVCPLCTMSDGLHFKGCKRYE